MRYLEKTFVKKACIMPILKKATFIDHRGMLVRILQYGIDFFGVDDLNSSRNSLKKVLLNSLVKANG